MNRRLSMPANLDSPLHTNVNLSIGRGSSLLPKSASSSSMLRVASSMLLSPSSKSVPSATPMSVTQVCKEEVSSTWSLGLTGQQFGLDTGRHQQFFEQTRPVGDLYSFDKHEIGRGAYGICVPASHRGSKTDCVVKIIEKKKAGKAYLDNMEEKGKDVFSTFLAMSAERHPNVVRYLDFLIGTSLILVIMEPLQGPELFQYISQLDSFPETFCRSIMKQVLAGVSFCHRWSIIHRDVKLENFRFRDAVDRESGLTLLDFGLCCPVHPHEKRELVGTLLYTAPEMSSGDYSIPVDMWATGVMLYVLLAGTFPFEHQSYEGTDNRQRSGGPLRDALRKLELQRPPAQAVDLLKSLLVRTPEGRLTADDALKHSWFSTDVPEESLLFEEDPRSRRMNYLSARTMSTLVPQLHTNKSDMKLLSVCSGSSGKELESIGPEEQSESSLTSIVETQSRPCHALMGTLLSNSTPCNIIFLDVDGVLAPCVNTGQIVKQCVAGVVALCQAAKARIVLTSSWRLLEGKVELLTTLLHQHDSSMVVFDVSPDLYTHELPEDALPEFDAQKFIRINDKTGFSLENALTALDIFGISDKQSKDSFKEVFKDPDFDLNVFSEETGEYTYECFSPRSRRAADWVLETCSAKFAETRCREIMFWLSLAQKSGFTVNKWVVLDDDNLLRRGIEDSSGFERQRTGNFSSAISNNENISAPPAPTAKIALPTVEDNNYADDDDPWAMAF